MEQDTTDFKAFYQGRRVLVTGHTGFKGSWLCHILQRLGAQVTGYALDNESDPNLYTLAKIESKVDSVVGDVCNLAKLREVFIKAQPEVVFHLAAQPIVRVGYQDPVRTYATNVMGTVNLLECVRTVGSVKSVVNVTTDKVYQNQEWEWGYRENDKLDGFDPYSNSKSCSELVSACFQRSFLQQANIALSTLRAGNVIGGGDFAVDRIIPDCVRSVVQKRPIEVRNPYSVRPYQHVLEPLLVYLQVAQAQFKNPQLAGSFNVGPNEDDCINTGTLAQLFCDQWGAEARWVYQDQEQTQQGAQKQAMTEAQVLRLDCAKLKSQFKWHPRWNVKDAVKYTVLWYKVWQNREDISREMDLELDLYLESAN